MRVYDILREDGWSEEKAEDNIMIALGGDDLRQVFRKMRDFQPFKRLRPYTPRIVTRQKISFGLICSQQGEVWFL